MKDVAGNEITAGNKVAFAGRQGSRAWLQLGTVEEVGVKAHVEADRLGLTVKSLKGGRLVYKAPSEVVVYGR